MTKHRMLAMGLVSGLLAAPAVASAGGPGSLNFDNYCVTGAIQVCASVRLQSVAGHLTMQVWNLQGTLGSVNTITSIGLYHSNALYKFTGAVSSYSVNYMQNGHSSNISSSWTTGGATDIKTLGGQNTELALGTSGNNGITGCTNPGGKNSLHWSTCNSFPGVPFVQFDFNFANNAQFDLTSTQLRWHSTQVPIAGSLKCDTGGYGDYPPCIGRNNGGGGNVTPEPVTMVLLGTGLAGMGGGALRRRRKQAAETPAA
ncbi:MAG TPA: PEP-CTERM sorting domain-containing protein [Gemmatimonadales bacterium]|nr:PEP-CTERM sorting domain-containing protein [Gemmatimonadales bacterium]